MKPHAVARLRLTRASCTAAQSRSHFLLLSAVLSSSATSDHFGVICRMVSIMFPLTFVLSPLRRCDCDQECDVDVSAQSFDADAPQFETYEVAMNYIASQILKDESLTFNESSNDWVSYKVLPQKVFGSPLASELKRLASELKRLQSSEYASTAGSITYEHYRDLGFWGRMNEASCEGGNVEQGECIGEGEQGAPQAMIILGPSSAGKSYMASNAYIGNNETERLIPYPFWTIDGGTPRSLYNGFSYESEKEAIEKDCEALKEGNGMSSRTRVSYIWQIFAVALPQCLHLMGFHDYYKKIFGKLPYKDNLLDYYLKAKNKKTNLVIPSVGTRVEDMVKKLEKAGYKVKFLVVTADYEEARQGGLNRAEKEKKWYDGSQRSLVAHGYALSQAAKLRLLLSSRSWTWVKNYPVSHKAWKILDMNAAAAEAAAAAAEAAAAAVAAAEAEEASRRATAEAEEAAASTSSDMTGDQEDEEEDADDDDSVV